MELYIFAFIAFLLFIPLIYILPSDLTKFGKNLILSLAFFVSIIGLLLESIMSIWIMSIILLFFIASIAYIVEKRFSIKIFKKKEVTSETGKKVIKFELEDDLEEIIQFDHSKDVINKEENSLSEIVENQGNQQVDLAEEMVSTKEDDNPQLIGNETYIQERETPSIDVLEEIKFEEQPIEQEESVASKYLLDESFDDYTKEHKTLEHVINGSEEDSNSTSNDIETAFQEVSTSKEIVETIEENKESILDELIREVEELENLHNSRLQETTNQLVANEINEENEQTSVESELEEDSLLDDIEEIPSLENETSSQSTTTFDMMSEEQEQLVDIEQEEIRTDEATEDIVTANPIVKQQVLQIMVSQLRLLQKQLPTAQYEKLILDHLHPELSDQDCYTFISLLIEHYVREEKYQKLLTVLMEYRARFKKYPIILQEINFLLEEYCKK